MDNLIKPPASGSSDLRWWTPKRGLPDYFCWTILETKEEKETRYFFVEVKSQKSPLSKEQKEVLNLLKRIYPVYIFRVTIPENFHFQLKMDPF